MGSNTVKDYLLVLQSWSNLNEFLRSAGEEDCHKLLKLERKVGNRPTYLLRIHSRLNKVRADREREEILRGRA